MMSVIELLKAACLNKPFKSFKDLQHGDYIIEGFSVVETSHGDRIRIELRDCFMFLPERFMRVLDECALANLKNTTVMMTYKGKDRDNRNRLILDFQTVKVANDEIQIEAVRQPFDASHNI